MTHLQTTISAVSVYPDRARVTRSGAATLEPGSYRLEIAELPLKLDPASVRASARGTARARLLGVDVRRDFYAETPAERVRELEKRIETLEDEMRGGDAQVELLKLERTALSELLGQAEPFARGLAFGKTSAEEQMALFDAVRGRAQEIDAALLELIIARREMEHRLQKLRNELDQLRGARRRERHTGIVEIEVGQAGDLTVELTYVVTGAGWQPLYDIRLSEEGEQPALTIGYLAQVTQRTGEDWEDVSLTLSTARPALADALPELDPWYIEPILPQKRREPARMKKMAAPAPALDTVAEAALPPPPAEAEMVTASVEMSGATVTYRVPGAVTVPADGTSHKVTVAGFDLTPDLDYVTAPKLVEEVYRRAQAANDSPYTLLPGPANLFSGAEFIGSARLEMIAPQEKLELYLGTDDRVQVERELVQREVEKKLLGDRRRMRYGYEITLENLLPVEARVTLHDQIPVPRHEEIKVKLESVEPKPKEQSQLNLLEWELTLAAGEKRGVRFDFIIEYPRGMTLLGVP